MLFKPDCSVLNKAKIELSCSYLPNALCADHNNDFPTRRFLFSYFPISPSFMNRPQYTVHREDCVASLFAPRQRAAVWSSRISRCCHRLWDLGMTSSWLRGVIFNMLGCMETFIGFSLLYIYIPSLTHIVWTALFNYF